MSYTIDDSNNVLDQGGTYIGSVCYKPYSEQGHWTGYLATERGDEVVGQYSTKEKAAEGVDAAYGRQVAPEWS